MVAFVVKRYAVREAIKWRYAVRKANFRRYAVRKGEGVSPSYMYIDCMSYKILSTARDFINKITKPF